MKMLGKRLRFSFFYAFSIFNDLFDLFDLRSAKAILLSHVSLNETRNSNFRALKCFQEQNLYVVFDLIATSVTCRLAAVNVTHTTSYCSFCF